MSITQGELTGNNDFVRGGVTGNAGMVGGTSTASAPPAVVNANPLSLVKALQTRWRPPSFVDFHRQLQANPAQASRDLDAALLRAHQGMAQLENMIACTQQGVTTVTGSLIGIPTGLTTVTTASGSIDQGSTAHNFWLTITPSAFAGAIDIYVWQPTAAGNNTPIACTTAIKVRWVVTGSL